MLRNQEKNSVVRGIFLIGGWGLGLDRFYEGDRNGLVALAIVNLLVILLFKFYLKGSGLLS